MRPLLHATVMVVGAWLTGAPAEGAQVNAGPSTILSHSMFSYATFGNGDVIFQLTQNPLPQCYGFWLRSSDPGFRTHVAIVLSVIQAQGEITVTAEDSDVWTGSTAKYCLVTGLLL